MPTPTKLERDEVLAAEPDNVGRAYIEDFESVAQFFAGDYRSLPALRARARELAARPANGHSDHAPLVRKLAAYHRALGAPAASLAAVKLLAVPGTFAVVTGQQPGLCGGPALTLHKTAHALRLAEQLTESGIPTVAVFWAASEDHDIAEVNRFTALDGHGKPVTVRLSQYSESGVEPLERLDLPPADDPAIQKIAALCHRGTHGDEAAALALAAAGLPWGRSLNTLLLRIFGDRGLIVLEPRLLRSLPAHNAAIAREMSRRAGRQPDWDGPFIALSKAGYREALPVMLPEESTYFVIRRAKRIPAPAIHHVPPHLHKNHLAETLADLEAHPDTYSPGVRLRPVVQGACLPVLAYIAGPAEIAYHALLKETFAYHGVPMPVLIPRWSMIAAPAGIPAADIARVRRTAADARTRARTAGAAIQESGNEIRAAVESLRKSLGPIAPHVVSDLAAIEQRADKALREYKGRLAAAPLAHLESAKDSLPVAAAIEPHSKPQEREISWLSLWGTHAAALRAEYARRDPFDLSVGVVLPDLPAP
jgi:bacillithiol biosynthesis cysteine-adding enzyme BshC